MNNELVIRYQKDVLQALADGAWTIIDYETRQYDPYNLVTVGAAWSYLCIHDGYYWVDASLLLAGSTAFIFGEYFNLAVYVNGAQFANLDSKDNVGNGVNTTYPWVHGGTLVYLVAGNTVDFRVVQKSGGAINTGHTVEYNYCSIHKV